MDERPLWAPWRLQYVAGPKGDGCIFCAAGEGQGDDERHYVLARGERCLAMLNAFPYASGHLMVAPYRHIGDLTALEPPEVAEVMDVVRRSIEALRTVMNPQGFNVGLNLGESAGAGFKDHLHFHVVPRWTGDTNFMPVLADTRVISQALADTAAALRGELTESAA